MALPVLFLAFWIIVNARLTLEVLLVGIVISVFMSLFYYRILGASFAAEKRIWVKSGKIIVFLLKMLAEIAKATVMMIKIILSPNMCNINPQLVYFKSPVETGFGKVLFTYSTILTPGSVVFHVDENVIGLHAIDRTVGQSINKSEMVKLIADIERGDSHVRL